MIINYTASADATVDALPDEIGAEVRRGIDKLQDQPYHPVSCAVNGTGSHRTAMVREGVMVEYTVYDDLARVVIQDLVVSGVPGHLVEG